MDYFHIVAQALHHLNKCPIDNIVLFLNNTNKFQDLGAVISGDKIMTAVADERAYIQDPKTGKMMGRKPEKGLTIASDNDTIIKRQEFSNEIKGTKTVTGVIITGVSHHNAQRMLERGISVETVKDALSTASISYPGNTPNTTCVQKNGLRIVYNNKGNIISSIVLREE